MKTYSLSDFLKLLNAQKNSLSCTRKQFILNNFLKLDSFKLIRSDAVKRRLINNSGEIERFVPCSVKDTKVFT